MFMFIIFSHLKTAWCLVLCCKKSSELSLKHSAVEQQETLLSVVLKVVLLILLPVMHRNMQFFSEGGRNGWGLWLRDQGWIPSDGSHFWFGCGAPFNLARSLRNGAKNNGVPLCVCTTHMQCKDPPLQQMCWQYVVFRTRPLSNGFWTNFVSQLIGVCNQEYYTSEDW